MLLKTYLSKIRNVEVGRLGPRGPPCKQTQVVLLTGGWGALVQTSYVQPKWLTELKIVTDLTRVAYGMANFDLSELNLA